MGSFSLMHWIVVLAIILILFGAGKLPRVMGDFAKGIKAFKAGMKEEEEPEATATPAQVPPPACHGGSGAGCQRRRAHARARQDRIGLCEGARCGGQRPHPAGTQPSHRNPSEPGRGRGLFAREAIAPGTLIEAAPVIILPAAQCAGARSDRSSTTTIFIGTAIRTARAAARLGLGLAHAVQPFEPPAARASIAIMPGTPWISVAISLRSGPGEEVTIDYGCTLMVRAAGVIRE